MTLSIAVSHRQGEFDLKVDLEIGVGLTALFGPSGSGKTTLINLVAGLARPILGRISFAGDVWVDTSDDRFVPAHRRRIGYVFQEGRLFPHLSVNSNLRYGVRFSATPPSSRDVDQLVDMLAIGALLGRRPGDLSGGEKQRVALGRALMSGPRLLLMDEPLSALDEGLKGSILPYIERIRDEAGIPIIYVSHSIEEVTRLATRVISVSEGRAATVMDTASHPGETSFIPGSGPLENFIEATIIEQSPTEGLTIAESRSGRLFLRHADLPVGRRVRVYIPASEIVLAKGEVGQVSTLNRLSGSVEQLDERQAGVSVLVNCAGERLVANITRRSATSLGLAAGMPVTLLFKAVSLAAEGVYRHPRY
ncbi:molybdenum ABC transporter ATP-binding protein [Ciceribacter sp. L1K22]|uniref:molybdenum ABC transporter ATP-binding protein n=1 Tax=Ciceribacter sp. L1K22 TaxID=2820275 RepID=UPI001ABDB136|nr:molybdenum ABC transporter ATP-binding protein [Ciceribacter sp. L1K22]MBO3759103.1 molybdenum ABC transporter ATP-binding protein [Ciceribacter sp. L1K22]